MNKKLKPLIEPKHFADTLRTYDDVDIFYDGVSDSFVTEKEFIANEESKDKKVNQYLTKPDQLLKNKTKKINPYPSQATPEAVGKLAERMERNAQMTGGKGPFTKTKVKKIKAAPVDLNFKIPAPSISVPRPMPVDPEQVAMKQRFEQMLLQAQQQKAEENFKNNPQGLMELIPGATNE